MPAVVSSTRSSQVAAAAPAPPPPAPSSTAAIQQMVARIYEACQAPPLSPPEYRLVFTIMAQEIATRGLMGAPTFEGIAQQGKDHGITLRRDDVRFILDVVREADPWFEQGVSAGQFASRFRDFVVVRCHRHGLTLSREELDLIDHWFAGSSTAGQSPQPRPAQAQLPAPPSAAAPPPRPVAPPPVKPVDPWWSNEAVERAQVHQAPTHRPSPPLPAELERMQGDVDLDEDEFPRIIRSRLRG
jgi:hypothetical protein